MGMAVNSTHDAMIRGDDGVDVDVARYTAVRAIFITKQQTIDRLFDFFTLIWMTFASVTTVVGVCMVMKHDGMDIDGWAAFLFGEEGLPYPPCPVWATSCSRLLHS